MLLRTAKSGNVMMMWSEASHRHGYRLDFGVQNYCFFLYPANIFRYFFHFARFFLLFPTFQSRQNVYSEERIRTFCCRFSCSEEGIRTFDCNHTNFRLLSYKLLTAIIRTFDCNHTNFRLLPYDHDLLSPRQQPRAFGGTTLTVLNHEQERLGLRHTTTGIRQPAIAPRQTPRRQ